MITLFVKQFDQKWRSLGSVCASSKFLDPGNCIYRHILSGPEAKKMTGFGLNQIKVKCMFDKYPFSATARNS